MNIQVSHILGCQCFPLLLGQLTYEETNTARQSLVVLFSYEIHLTWCNRREGGTV